MWVEGYGELPGHLIVVSGPSGSGKTTIVHRLLDRAALNLHLSISATTRDPRPGEKDGVDYKFLSKKDFHPGESFLEFAEYNGNFYGTPKEPVLKAMSEGKNVLLEIEVQGAVKIRQIAPETLFVFIKTKAFRDLADRLHSRGTESSSAIHKRLVRARQELAESHWYDVEILNEDLDVAVEQLAATLTHYVRGG